MNPPVSRTVESVLVVDDSPSQRDHAVRLCRALGVAEVHQASDGAEALTLLARLSPTPTVMIIDIEMPRMNGMDLLEEMRIRGIRMDLIVASGRESALIDSVMAVGAGMGLNMLAGLEKPLTLESLGLALNARDGPFSPSGGTIPDSAPTIPPAELERALAQRQIRVAYQPKADMRTGLTRGVETLARWECPTRGAVPPAQFVALAEQYGLIHPLTFSVLEQALEQTAKWNSRGLRLGLSVNLSPLLLHWPSLAQDIFTAIDRHGVPAEQVTFEITECSVGDSLGAARGLLAKLRLRGFGLAIDDYGTGFSSMQQLARVPFTELKIDRSFVHGSTERKDLRVMLHSAIDMARQLNLTCTAEGIETLDEWRLVQRLGCTAGQGYFVARPMPGADIPKWIRQQRDRAALLRAPEDAAAVRPAHAALSPGQQ